MTSAFVSRWPVLQEHRVTAADLDADGVIRDERVAQWVAAARSAYLRRCVALRRVREGSGDRDGAVDVSCIVRLVDPSTGEPRELGTEVRDELIALEHAAEHYN
jgi:acyl-CoA thioesterase FadM